MFPYSPKLLFYLYNFWGYLSKFALSVNDWGNITSTTDLNGHQINYSYDLMGRVTFIDPVDPTVADTSISYQYAESADTAVTQTIQRSNYRKTTKYDGLLRPRLSAEWDADNPGQTIRYTNRLFNVYGKETFVSVASKSAAESFGTSTVYDGMQRVKSQTNTANGDVSYTFHDNNRVTLTNGRGINTTTTYRAFGKYEQQDVIKIEQAEGVTTSLVLNVFSNPLTITQGGISEQRVYNASQQLCVVKRPETGIKAMVYNGYGQLSRAAEGLTGNGTSCSDYQDDATAWVHLEYDNHGAQQSVTFADGTPSVEYTYDPQGNLLKLAAGNTAWDYTYNSQNQRLTEWLTVDNLRFEQNHEYNRLGHLSKDTFLVRNLPNLNVKNGSVITYAPNALGQSTQVSDGTTYFARYAQYHPNGQLKSFNYGNGLKFEQTMDAEQRPYERHVHKTLGSLLSQRYIYDDNNNVESIFDLQQPSNTIHLTYDGLNRLETGTGPWGYGEFIYDTLSNIETKILGSQRLNYNYDRSTNRLSSFPGKSFSYDTKGNVTHNGVRNFTYNAAQQLKSSGTGLSYVYDGYNRRIKQLHNGQNNYTAYNAAGQLVHRLSAAQLSTFTLYLGSALVAEIDVTGPPVAPQLPVIHLSVSEQMVSGGEDSPDCPPGMVCEYGMVPQYNYGWQSSHAQSCSGTLQRTRSGVNMGITPLTGISGTGSVISSGDGSLFTLSLSCTGSGGTSHKTQSFGGVGSEM